MACASSPDASTRAALDQPSEGIASSSDPIIVPRIVPLDHSPWDVLLASGITLMDLI